MNFYPSKPPQPQSIGVAHLRARIWRVAGLALQGQYLSGKITGMVFMSAGLTQGAMPVYAYSHRPIVCRATSGSALRPQRMASLSVFEGLRRVRGCLYSLGLL